ncbi:hypothetical protein HYT91_03800 [Candidatus Pacearchaeota archaeon]|nr:hypothetical protein [Candidatus Pacearchaeota archaeon]
MDKETYRGIIKCFLLILILTFLTNFISSIVYGSYQETAEIVSEDEVHESIEIFINADKSESSISFFLVPGISNLQVYLDDKKLESCEAKEKAGETEISCSLENSFIGKHFFKIEFDSSYPLIKLNQDRLMFRSGYEPIVETKKFLFVLKLPLGHVIPEEPNKDKSFFISPEEELLYSDGQRIVLKWEDKLLDEKFEVSVISEPLKKKFNIWPIILILMVIFFLLVYFKNKIKYKKARNIRNKRKPKSEIIEEHLMESEKKIIDELKNAEAKLSRVIRNLEARNIIQKIPFGNTNKIKLKIK